MEDNSKKHTPARKDFAFGISFSEFVISLILGTASGLATAANRVRELFHDDAHEATAFKKHFATRADRLDRIELKNFKSPLEYWKATTEEKRLIADEYDALALKFRGVRKSPILGTLDRFQTLSPRSKGNLYFSGAVGAVVGAALTLGFFNGVATRDKIDKIGDAVNADKER